MTEPNENSPPDTPPIFQTWNQLYLFVLILHTIIIALFYWLTQSFS